MSFNPDPTKQAQGIILVAKPHREITRELCLIIVQLMLLLFTSIYLGMIFDSKLSFDEHLKSVLKE